VVIAVHSDHRQQGVGTKLIEWLIDYAAEHAIRQLSLSVSKDNHALNLYRQQGFQEHGGKGDMFIMVRRIQS
jgi:ribosomal protein S18 acetylase RimI-like enzyme